MQAADYNQMLQDCTTALLRQMQRAGERAPCYKEKILAQFCHASMHPQRCSWQRDSRSVHISRLHDAQLMLNMHISAGRPGLRY